MEHEQRAYPESDQEEEVREGHEPAAPINNEPQNLHTLDTSVRDDRDDESRHTRTGESEESKQWKQRDHTSGGDEQTSSQHRHPDMESNVWDSPKR